MYPPRDQRGFVDDYVGTPHACGHLRHLLISQVGYRVICRVRTITPPVLLRTRRWERRQETHGRQHPDQSDGVHGGPQATAPDTQRRRIESSPGWRFGKNGPTARTHVGQIPPDLTSDFGIKAINAGLNQSGLFRGAARILSARRSKTDAPAPISATHASCVRRAIRRCSGHSR